MKFFEPIEPLRSNRWVIRTSPTVITDFLFREYKMYNEGEEIILEASFFESIIETYNPKDLMNITDLKIEYFNPVGDVVGGFDITVKGVNFEKHHSYTNDDLLITNLRFVIRDIKPLFINYKEKVNVSHGEPKE